MCPYCSGDHDTLRCPRIRSIRFAPSGMVSEIEFHDEPARNPAEDQKALEAEFLRECQEGETIADTIRKQCG